MSKTKRTKDHKKRLAAFKVKRKQQQDTFKKMMYDNYIKAQQEYLAAQEAHKETEEQEIEIDTGDFNLEENIEVENIEVPDIEFPEETEK